MKFWPFPLLRNHRNSAALSQLFETVASQPDFRVSACNGYYTSVACSLGELTFWTANAYYAWAQDGTWRPAKGGEHKWNHVMPSRWAVRQMVLAMDRQLVSDLSPEAA